MGFLDYNIVERGAESQYPNYEKTPDGIKPNLRTYLEAINKSQPIINCQYELVWSRWPRTIFFAKNITIPGISVNTLELNHAGFTVQVPTHVTYESTDISMQIIADKEGFHYYDLRNMVLQTGHPLVAGDPKATVGNPFNVSPNEDILEIRLRNRPEDETHHHWIIHNFHPTGIGDLELTVDGASFVEFELKGTFTHISYDCGKSGSDQGSSENSPNSQSDESDNQEQKEQEYDEEEYDEEDEEYYDEDEEGEEEEEGDEGADDWDNQDEYTDEEWEQEQAIQDAENENQESSSEESGGDDEGQEDATLDDDDEKSAYEAIKNNDGKSDAEIQKELTEKLKRENPNENPEILETRAELAMDAAKKYAAQHPTEKKPVFLRSDATKQPRLVLCKNMCGWVGQSFGNANETLTRAVRFNHKVSRIKHKMFIDNVDQELREYSLKISRLSLPHRFGMYKSLKNNAKIDDSVELDTPKTQIDSTYSSLANPNHKIRSIF